MFYNPAMALDRDLGVALARAALPPGAAARGAELLAATGIRGLRLLAEADRFGAMLFLEGNPEAVRVLGANARGTDARRTGVVCGDARAPPFRPGLDYVDVDPYGTPAPFLAGAVGVVRDGGLLAVTATDLPVLCGVARGVAERRYGGRPIRGRLGPEGGLRLLLATMARVVRGGGRHLEVVAAYVHDHHLRAIARVAHGSGGEDPIGTVDPGTFDGPTLPPGPPYGPMWLGPLFEPGIVAGAQAPERAADPRSVARWLAVFQTESLVPVPFYYEANVLAHQLHLSSPPSPGSLIDRLRDLGYAAAFTHARPGAFRTTAPRAEVERVARAAARAD